jgi:hypothetical protein
MACSMHAAKPAQTRPLLSTGHCGRRDKFPQHDRNRLAITSNNVYIAAALPVKVKTSAGHGAERATLPRMEMPT